MTRWIACVVALLLAFPLLAQGPKAVRKQVESSMVLTGTIDVGASGDVDGYTIDHVEKIPKGVSGLVAKFVPQWKFEPVLVAGKPVKARAKMSMRIVAKERDDGSYVVGIDGANFGQDGPGESVDSKQMLPPSYPMDAAINGAGGTVYLAVQIGRDGRVREVVVEQVNLTMIASERVMARWRGAFAKSASRAARTWTFTPPLRGESMDDNYWLARIPVAYSMGDEKPGGYGQWEAYVPGPRHVAPWGDSDSATTANPDALPASGVFQIGQGLRLLTPLDQG